ncbi:unnamed protein product [Leptidea sinapis]|uniref:Uncharacterized protein n=1 Tax=Leptidea sinapis TaxID=189913 RepID=A0A5E4R0P2_9NEOP|nr:unnamed protein product [Leptidea sinapis]
MMYNGRDSRFRIDLCDLLMNIIITNCCFILFFYALYYETIDMQGFQDVFFSAMFFKINGTSSLTTA